MRSFFISILLSISASFQVSAQTLEIGDIILLQNSEAEAQLGVWVDHVNRLNAFAHELEEQVELAVSSALEPLTTEDLLRYYRQRGRLFVCDGGAVEDAEATFVTLDAFLTSFVSNSVLTHNPDYATQDPPARPAGRRASFDAGVSSGCPNAFRLRARLVNGPVGQALLSAQNANQARALAYEYQKLIYQQWDQVGLNIPSISVDELEQ